MQDKKENMNKQEEGQPGSMSSYNNRQDNREGAVEQVKEHKDETESYQDYNGNSEANAPARSRGGE